MTRKGLLMGVRKVMLAQGILAFAGSVFGDVRATRFGAVYAPRETAAFTCDAGGAWRVTDWQGNEIATGTTAGGSLSISHAALGLRSGAFRLAIGSDETWFAFLPTAKVRPCGWVGTGTHGSHGWSGGDYRYLDLIAAAGIGVVRDDVGWQSSEREKGKYVFDGKLHGLVDGLRQRGIRFHPVLLGQNALYENPLDPDAYAAFAAAFVGEFKGKVASCDIFNEPHNTDFPRVYLPEGGEFKDWQCRPDAPWIPKHRELTRKAVSAIKAVDPGFSPGVGVEDYWAFFKSCMLANNGAPSGLVAADDLVSIHTYGTKTEARPEMNYLFVDGGQDVLNTLRQNGGATRLVITEAGWTTCSGSEGLARACSLVEQAQYLVRFHILARQHGVEFACQYDFMNDGSDRTNQEHNFGIVREDYTPKPSFSAVATMTRLIGNAAPLGSKSANEAEWRFYDFSRGDRRVMAAWSLDGERSVDVPDGCSLEGVRCVDLQGNEIPVPVENGRLRLTEAPIYLVDAVGGLFDDDGERWTSCMMSEAIPIVPGVKSMDEALTAMPVNTGKIGPIISFW